LFRNGEEGKKNKPISRIAGPQCGQIAEGSRKIPEKGRDLGTTGRTGGGYRPGWISSWGKSSESVRK